MCITCYELINCTVTDDYWIPVKHKCHDIQLAAIRIPAQSQQEKNWLMARLTYLMEADLPFVQQIFDFFVLQNEIVVIVKKPQITLQDLKLQNKQFQDNQILQVSYSMAMSIMMCHRHKIRVGSCSLRDFLLFQDQYVCLSVEKLLKPLCVCWTPRCDIVTLVENVMVLNNDYLEFKFQICQQCQQQTYNLSELVQQVQFLAFNQNRSSAFVLCSKLLQQFNWRDVLSSTFLSKTRIAPLVDDLRAQFNSQRCENVQRKMHNAVDHGKSKDDNVKISDNIDPKIKKISQRLFDKFQFEHNYTEQFLGIECTIESELERSNRNEATTKQNLQKFVEITGLQQREESSKFELIQKQNENINANNINSNYQFLVIYNRTKLIDDTLLYQAMLQLYKQNKYHSLEELVVIIRIYLFQRGVIFLQNDKVPVPFNYDPILPLIDYQGYKCQRNLKYIADDNINTFIEHNDDIMVYGASLKEEILHSMDEYIEQLVKLTDNVNSIMFPGFEQQFNEQQKYISISPTVIRYKHIIKSTVSLSFLNLQVSLLDLIIIQSGIDIISAGGIWNKAFHYIANFKSKASKLSNSFEQTRKQQLFFTYIAIYFFIQQSSEYSKQSIINFQNILNPDSYQLLYQHNPTIFKQSYIIQQGNKLEIDQQYYIVCACDSQEELCKECASKQQQLTQQQNELIDEQHQKISQKIGELIIDQLFESRMSLKEMIEFYGINIQIVLHYLLKINKNVMDRALKQIIGQQINNQFIVDQIDFLLGECTEQYQQLKYMFILITNQSIVDLYIQQTNMQKLDYLIKLQQKLSYELQNHVPSNMENDQFRYFALYSDTYTQAVYHHIVKISNKWRDINNMSFKQFIQSVSHIDPSNQNELFEYIFEDSYEKYVQAMQIPNVYIDYCSIIFQQSKDNFINPNFFNYHAESYANTIMQLCYLLVLFNQMLSNFNQLFSKINTQQRPLTLLSIQQVQQILTKCCSNQKLFQYGINFKGLQYLSECVPYVQLSYNLFQVIFSETTITNLLHTHKFNEVASVYCKLIHCIRGSNKESQNALQTASSLQQSLKQMSINKSFQQKQTSTVNVQQNFNLFATKLEMVAISKIGQQLINTSKLLGPSFMSISIALITESSYQADFWNDDSDVYNFCCQFLENYIKNLKCFKNTLQNIRLINDVVTLMLNIYQKDNNLFNFQSMNNKQLIKLLLNPHLKENNLVFILYIINQLGMNDAQQTVHIFAEQLISMFNEPQISKKYILVVLYNLLNQIEKKDLSDENKSIYKKFYFSAFQNNQKLTDQQYKEILQMVNVMTEYQIFEDFTQSNICFCIVDLLKQKGKEIRGIIISILYKSMEQKQIIQQFSQLGCYNVLKRINVTEMDQNSKEYLPILLKLFQK